MTKTLTGFQLVEKAILKKGTRLVLGLDPTDEEVKTAETHGGLENYLKWLIDETHEHVVAIKPQLAFYEKSPEWRGIAMRVMNYAHGKYGLVRILDVKRGDIANTQSYWAAADIGNFHPDIVVVNAYMGGVDVVLPYLAQNDHICVYVLTATSNPGARDFQDLVLANGLTNYQQMAIHCRQLDEKLSHRIGYVVGSTKTDGIKNIRMLEAELGITPGHVLSPGFGRQGKNLEFAKFAGHNNTIYSISSALTNPKLLDGKTPKAAATWWRDEINKMVKQSVPTPTLTEYVASQLIEKDLILIPKTPDVATWPLMKRGRDKLKAAGVDLTGSDKQKIEILRAALNAGTLEKADFAEIYLQLRDLMGHVELRRLVSFLYAELIRKSGVTFDRVGSIAYGAINTGDLVGYALNKPGFLVRKERGAESTHSDVLGGLNPGDTAIMIEDVTTTASSLIRDVQMLRDKFGIKITDAFVLVKRTEESEKHCRDNGVTLHYILDMPRLKQIITKHADK